MINNERFFAAFRRVSLGEELQCGIGTLSERSVHKLLKLYYEPNEEYHEVKYLGSVADIMREGEITEIQTGSLLPLRRKLEKFLKTAKVTVVHPIIAEKTLCTVMKDGSIKRRRSPRTGSIYSAAFELFALRDFLTSDNLTVRLVFLSCDEYRRCEGGRRGEKLNTAPRGIISELELKNPRDYLAFLPDGLPQEFTSKEFLSAIKSRSRYDYYAIRLLEHLGLVTRAENRGRAYVYKINTSKEG